MVKPIEINGRRGYGVSEKDYLNAEPQIVNGKKIYFFEYKHAKKVNPINKEVLEEYIKAGTTKDKIIELMGTTVNKLNFFLKAKYQTTSIKQIKEKLN